MACKFWIELVPELVCLILKLRFPTSVQNLGFNFHDRLSVHGYTEFRPIFRLKFTNTLLDHLLPISYWLSDLGLNSSNRERHLVNFNWKRKLKVISYSGIVAAHYSIPFYIAAPFTTIDLECESGESIGRVSQMMIWNLMVTAFY